MGRVKALLTAAGIVTGTLTAAEQSVTLTVGSQDSNWAVQVIGSFTGLLRTEASLDGVTFVPIAFRRSSNGGLGNRVTQAGLYRGNVAGLAYFRVRAEKLTAGTPTVILASTPGIGAVFPNTFNIAQSVGQYYSSTSGGNVHFNATSGLVSVPAAQTAPVALVRNPVGSGVDLYVSKLATGATNAGIFTRFRGGGQLPGAVNTPGAMVTIVNRGGGATASLAQFYPGASFSVTTPGVAGRNSFSSAQGGSDPDAVDGSIILRPGEFLYWLFQNTASGNVAVTVSVEAAWWESGALT